MRRVTYQLLKRYRWPIETWPTECARAYSRGKHPGDAELSLFLGKAYPATKWERKSSRAHNLPPRSPIRNAIRELDVAGRIIL